MAALVAAIHFPEAKTEAMDGRDRPGHDELAVVREKNASKIGQSTYAVATNHPNLEGGIMRKFLLAAAAVSALMAGAATTAANANPVLMISVDGLRPLDVIDADKRGLNVPNLRAFMADGAYATGVKNVLPTVTYPDHTTLITGVWPDVHGIGNNVKFDPLDKNYEGWYWYSSDIKVPTLWDVVHNNHQVVASIDWP